MDNDGKRPIQNAPTLEHWFGAAAWGEIFYTKNNAFLAGYPISGALVGAGRGEACKRHAMAASGSSPTEQRHAITSVEVFNAHAAYDPVFRWNNVFPCSTDTLNTIHCRKAHPIT